MFCGVFGGLLFEEEALGLLMEMLTFIFSSDETTFSVGGRKSGTMDNFPTGLSGSIIFFLIISFVPIPGTEILSCMLLYMLT